MNPFISPLLAATLLVPTAPLAATISRIVADLDVIATFDPGPFSAPPTSLPTVSDFDEVTALINGLQTVEAFVPAGLDFRTQPTPDGPGFGSAAGDAFGNFAVGVNSFFLSAGRGDPLFVTSATGTYQEDILNDTDEAVTLGTNFFIPAPVVTVAGQIGNGRPGPVDPRDPTGEASARLFAAITRLDGSIEESLVLDYGLSVRKDPTTGDFGAVASRDARGLTATEEFNSFSFALAEFSGRIDAVATLAPGESVVLDFQYFARGTNGFGETGYFAAIGDPFDIDGGGGRFEVTFADDGVDPPPVDPPPSAVPVPASLPLLGLGLAALAMLRRRMRG